jgi:type IV pilus biogenesis/stability protein PilW
MGLEMKRMILRCGFTVLAVISMMVGGCATSQNTSPQGSSDYHARIGTAYLGEGKYQLAYVEFQKAIMIDANNRDALYNLGLACYHLEDYEKSKQYFLQALSITPDYPDAHNNLGLIYMQLGQWKEAEEHFQKAVSNPIYKTPELAYYSLGMIQYRQGRYDNALESFKASVRRDRNFALPYYGMALAYNRLERFGEAADLMEKAISVDGAYKGDREKKTTHLRERLYSAKGAEERDIRDFLEIMQY